MSMLFLQGCGRAKNLDDAELSTTECPRNGADSLATLVAQHGLTHAQISA